MSLIKVNDIQTTTGVPNRGKVLQVIQAIKTDYSLISTSASWVDLPPQGGSGSFSLSITPSSTNSKVWLSYIINGMMTASANCWFRLLRGSTAIGIADQYGVCQRSGAASLYGGVSGNQRDTNTTYHVSQQYLDSPSTTSSTTYKVQVWVQTNTSLYIGNSGSLLNSSDMASSPAITLIAMEIAA